MARLSVQGNMSSSVVMSWKNHPAKKGEQRTGQNNHPGTCHLQVSTTYGPLDQILVDSRASVSRETHTSNIYFTLAVKTLKMLCNNIFLKIGLSQYKRSTSNVNGAQLNSM